VGDNGEISRVWTTRPLPNAHSVTLPTTPRNPRSVCATQDGMEIKNLRVLEREVSWNVDLPSGAEVLFRYLE